MTYLDEEKIAKIEKELDPLPKAFDLLPDHVVVTDLDGLIIYVNKAVREQTGYDANEVIGKNPGKLWGGQMSKEFYEKMWQTIKVDKKPFVGEVKNKRKDGSFYWQELMVYPVLDEAGEIKVFIGLEPNIDARKKLESEFKFKYQAIERLNKFMIGRELKMIELKKEVEKLKKELLEAK